MGVMFAHLHKFSDYIGQRLLAYNTHNELQVDILNFNHVLHKNVYSKYRAINFVLFITVCMQPDAIKRILIKIHAI